MKCISHSPFVAVSTLGAIGLVLAATGCTNSVVAYGRAPEDLTSGDMTYAFSQGPDGGPTDDSGITPCLDNDPSCIDNVSGPLSGKPFPLKSDAMPDPNEDDTGLSRDPNGYLGLDQTHAAFDYLWVANTDDWNRGTVSKIDSKKVREVARYLSVTCYSLPTGTSAACDGTNGCCAGDDYPRFQARLAKMNQPAHQAVDPNNINPSRTAIDFNGDMYVANRAFSGQSSVTKVANDLSECVDRNKNKKIDTSSDVNGDGLIQTDCNGNGVLDNIADVMATPCKNGMPQEFYGGDDECILWTTNTNAPLMYGRPLTLGPGMVDSGPSDAWAGGYNNGKFFRLDGTTGLTKAQAQGPVNAYGATTDANNIVWIAVINDGKLGYFDATTPTNTGVTRAASFGLNAYGICLDRDQNIWQGGWTNGGAFRYTPDRTNGFKNLGNGYWTVINNPGSVAGAAGNSRGIAVDSRTANTYFAWVAKDAGWIARINASAIPVPKGADVMIDGSMFPAFHVAGSNTIGSGVDEEQNIWGVSNSGSAATRAVVDMNGNITPPDIAAAPMGNNLCPAGDRCVLKDNNNSSPDPYTYSDFTGFGLRNFTNPKGSYTYIEKGCTSDTGDTQWYAVNWDADVPPNTSLTVRVRTGTTPVPDGMNWGNWTAPFSTSPADLRTNMPLAPQDVNDTMDAYIQVEFDFATMTKTATPKLKSFDLAFKCQKIG